MLNDIILFLVGIMAGSMNAIVGGGSLIAFPMMLAVGSANAGCQCDEQHRRIAV